MTSVKTREYEPTPYISELRLTPIPGNRTVIYQRRPEGSTLTERVRAQAIAYRTYVADGRIYTEVLVENGAGEQEYVRLDRIHFMKKAADIERAVPSTAIVREML